MSSPQGQALDNLAEESLLLSASAEGEVKVNSDQVDKISVNSVSADSLQEQQRITRMRTLTEKGLAYQEELQREREKEQDQLVKKFHETYNAWKMQAANIESSIAEQLPSSQKEKEEAISRLKDLHEKAQKIYETLRNARPPGQEIRQKMDACDSLTQTLDRQLGQQSTKGESASHQEEDRRSVRSRLSSKASTKSSRSRASRSSRASSLIDLKKADAAAELAAKEAEFNALQEQAKHKEDIAKMEAQLRAETTRIESELARRKLELEQSEVKKQMEIARARLKAYQEVEELEDDIDPVEDDILRISPIQTQIETVSESLLPPQEPNHSTTGVNVTNSTTQPPQQHQNVDQSFHVQPQESSNSDTTDKIVTAITESFSMSRLPAPEPTIFSGKPIQYPDWKSSFQAIIHRKNLPPSDKMYYLKRYVSGSAKEAISGLFLQNSSEAYERAWNILDERFGHPFVVAKAYRDQLHGWPRIGVKDRHGLRRFADFITSVETAMQTIEDLKILNDYMENQKLLTKLPDWLVSRWNREVTRQMKEEKKYPDFKAFATFINAEADFACNPISSCYAVKEAETTSDNTNRAQKPKDERSKTVHSAKTTEESSKQLKETPKQQPQCAFCKKTNHQLDACLRFKTETLENRMNFVKENRLCFGCLKTGHMSLDCRKRLACSTCNKKHPTCLHDERKDSKKKEDRSEEDKPASVPKSTSCASQGASSVSTSMIVPVWLSSSSKPEKEVPVYAILDTQSDATFILNDICDQLGAETQPTKLRLSTITSQESLVDSQRVTSVQVRGYDSNLKISIPVAYTSTSIPADEDHIPTKTTAKNWDHLQAIEDKMHDLLDCNVGLLIGYDCSQALTPREVVAGKSNEPYGIKTDLGWSIVGGGNVEGETSFCHKVAVKELPVIQMNDIVRILESDFKETKEDKKTSQEDLQFLKTMEEGIERTENGHYQMPLPFKDRPLLPNNRSMALTRLECLKRRFSKDPKYKEDYIKFMNEVLNRGDAEEVSSLAQEGAKWYIPHHGVYHPKKNKIRVVFDCSARFKGTSLNNHLLSGPDLTNSLTGVLCRFRRYPYAITCDVEKMFHQFMVCPNDRDYLRFLWWPNGDSKQEPKEYRMKVHLFGATSSPGCASYGFKHMASQEREAHPPAAQFITHDFYVDDGLASVESAEQAKDLIQGAREICKQGGLRLHKFISNDREVLESVPKSERAVDAILDLPSEQVPIERVLGVQWSVGLDCFGFSIVLKDQPLTRRGVLATVASVYDPLGFLAPLILRAKKILQEVCKRGVSWDEPLPEEVQPRWERWKLDLLRLKELQIPRCFEPKTMSHGKTYELHNFADASTFGYGQCSYLRVKDEDGNVNVSLVMGKSRVAPSKITTIPRLELTAAVVSAKVGTMLQDELNYANLKQHFWTDSKVVLGYINNDAKRFHTFVANRVQIIRSNTDTKEWRYIDTKNNPADHASRGLNAEDLMKSNWFSGPAFLWEKDIPFNEQEEIPDIQIGDPEIKATVRTTTVKESFSLVECVSRFSSWTKAVGVVSYLQRTFKKNKPRTVATTVTERKEAEVLIFKELQRTAFKNEVLSLSKKEQNAKLPRQSSLLKLDPFIDEQGLIRVGGRLENSTLPFDVKHPIILPKHSEITELIIGHFHKRVKHQGKGMTMNEIRSHGLWILGLNGAVASHIYKCVPCRRQRRPTEGQKMANLPEDRVESTPPFTYCGMDCFGPFTIKEGRKELKRYAVIFTCMSSRAVHIEQLDDMTTDAFINALRCFTAIRGPVQQLRSDQGSNFVGARNELSIAMNELDNERIQSYLTKNRCEFVMNVPYSSHWGGVWERQIRTTRSILNTVLNDYKGRLDTSSLRTFFYEVMAIINSRPLTCQCLNDPKSLEPLTPNHLLTMKNKTLLPPPGNFVKEDIYARKRWRRVQFLAEHFWSRWRKEYLINLNSRQKWFTPKRNLKIGDIVIVQEEVPRNEWPLGRIMETSTDQQGLVRAVKIKLGFRNSQKKESDARKQVIERPVQKVVLLMEGVS